MLHYSRRSARAFLEAARSGRRRNLGTGAAAMLYFGRRRRGPARRRRDQVTAAASPDENALFEALGRALQPRSGSRF